jgi:ribose transport system ATP-binding protein
MSVLALEVVNAGVTYPGVRALDGVDIAVEHGEVHALVGHNGSGKSTLVKVLAGQCNADAATDIRVNGRPLPGGSPRASASMGLRFVHQNLGLVPELSVTENLAIGRGFARRGLARIRWHEEHEAARTQLASLGYQCDPRTELASLPMAARSIVALARAVYGPAGADVSNIVLDETTASMSAPDIARLFETLTALRDRQVGILYVSHHLNEVLSLADRITVIRSGRKIATVPAESVSEADLVEMMVGSSKRSRVARHPTSALTTKTAAGARLTVESMSGGSVTDMSFVAEAGEIVGVGGISGSGREDVARLLIGAIPRAGSVYVGDDLVPPNKPHHAARAGLAIVASDRLQNGVIPSMNIRENITISDVGRFWRRVRLDRRRESLEVMSWIDRLRIYGATPEGDVMKLSGGNQQKTMVARALRGQPRVLILDSPTQGVDVAAIADLNQAVLEAARTSIVLVISNESRELANLCTRVIIMRGGRVAGVLEDAQITEREIQRLEIAGDVSGVS